MNNFKYDFLIVGAGFYGAVVAHGLNSAGKRVKVVEKRTHIAGNAYTELVNGINVHKYGAHIFHCNDERIWNYLNSFSKIQPFVNSPLAISKGVLYNLPFNMNTFHQLWGVITPEEAEKKIQEQAKPYRNGVPSNLEEQALALVGPDIYEALIKGYTTKQWGRDPKELPSFIIKRLPLRFTFDNNYFNDAYQGIPVGGYTALISNMLKGIEVELGVDYIANRSGLNALAKNVIYTGPIDEFFDYRLGVLEYRSLKFITKVVTSSNFQGNAVVNYCDENIPYTRIIEHKHFLKDQSESTVYTEEYPLEWKKGVERYYPINDSSNNSIYKKYKELAKYQKNIYFGGRLASYKYYDMHQVIGQALNDLNNNYLRL